MPGREYNAGNGGYRFGFQKQEKETDFYDIEGGAISFKFRIYDTRIGRFLSIDPLTKKYPYWTPYQFSGNQVMSSIELEGLESSVDLNAQVRATITLGSKRGTSHIDIGAAIGASARNSFGQVGLNVAATATNGGLGSANGKSGSINANLIVSPSLTIGTGQTSTAAPLNTFQSGAPTAVNNNFSVSGTTAVNLVWSNRNEFQRVGAYAIKAGDVSLSVYNDRSVFLGGDDGDKRWTGGGNLTIMNFMGNRNSSLTVGTDVFTGNSIPSMAQSAEADKLMPTYSYGRGGSKSLHYAGQSPQDQSLNMGQTFIRVVNSGNIFQVSHSGRFDMWSQNLIHDAMDFHRFLSTTPNQFNISGGSSAGTTPR